MAGRPKTAYLLGAEIIKYDTGPPLQRSTPERPVLPGTEHGTPFLLLGIRGCKTPEIPHPCCISRNGGRGSKNNSFTTTIARWLLANHAYLWVRTDHWFGTRIASRTKIPKCEIPLPEATLISVSREPLSRAGKKQTQPHGSVEETLARRSSRCPQSWIYLFSSHRPRFASSVVDCRAPSKSTGKRAWAVVEVAKTRRWEALPADDPPHRPRPLSTPIRTSHGLLLTGTPVSLAANVPSTMTAPHSVESSNIPSALISIRAADLLALGKPFVEFPRYSILDLQRTIGAATGCLARSNYRSERGSVSDGSAGFEDWLSKRLQIGHPFVIQDFEKLPQWDKRIFSIEGLIEHSTKKNIPIRNCSTSRDLNFTLRKFADAAQQSYREFKNLYARDLPCPEAWLELCRKLLPPEVQWAGRLDLFQWLPPCARSEVMMAYVGSEGSSFVALCFLNTRSGFHRCFSSTVALNLLIEGSVLCFGTDFESQTKYDAFMASRGASPHVDWLNLNPEELKRADFPLYVYEQKVGDLVVFPPATAHQVWNLGSISTKIVWNILHPLSLEAGLVHVQPPLNRLCHPDVAQSNLSLACAMLSLIRDDHKVSIPPDLHLLTGLFRQMVQEEALTDPPVTPVTLVRVPETAIITCDFCSTAIWNRHLRCSECEDFDLCLLCFLSGRSCEHIRSYSWAEIVPEETCALVLDRAQQVLGYQLEASPASDRRKPLGTAVNDLMRAKQNTLSRLCHLCRIDHLEWKGRRCDRCSAFFCFRGLYRHFDMNSADVMRHSGLWICPKCLETCNCRCCHFTSAYVKAEKPASKRRRNTPNSSGNSNTIVPTKGQKRQLSTSPSTRHSLTPRYPTSSANAMDHLTRNFDYAINNHILDRTSSQQADSEQGRAKVPRPSHKDSRVNTQAQEDGKTLHSIEYITRMPSPAVNNISLPPLKSGCSPERIVDMAPSPAMKRHSTDVATFGNLNHVRNNMSMQHIRDIEREEKHDINPDGPASTTPITTNALPHQPPPYTAANVNPLPPFNHPPFAQTTLAPGTHFRPTTTSTSTSTSTTTVPTSLTSISPSVSGSPSSSSLETLESQLHRLRQYAEDLLALSMHESHRLLQQEIHHLEETLLLAKRERSERLLRGLEAEFPGLVGVREGVRREGARLGYFG
ncbi:predicted protein [Uncinocarpus reesii 1704]|uniref:JmjC domain-containing protein n=1 Tax=Uncinocarpus reesii (strain UAMH 1704) TaxID=336963 RepID=C4JF64_UNCRE|nr:uncharacterized protein UREG_02286 [Uncinocarpus reesii 1704]EEP77437.1 predicted protein [Uncinocarpus reesii 1704]